MLSVDHDASTGRIDQAADHRHCRALAGSVVAEQHGDLALVDVERETLDRLAGGAEVRVALGDSIEANDHSLVGLLRVVFFKIGLVVVGRIVGVC